MVCAPVCACVWMRIYETFCTCFNCCKHRAKPRANQHSVRPLSCGVPEVPFLIIDWALLCRGPVLSRSSRAEWPQLAFGCRTLWTQFTFQRAPRKCEWKWDAKRKEKQNKRGITSPHPMFLSIIVICYDSRVLCKCLRVCVCVKDMLKVEKVNRCVCKSVPRPRRRLQLWPDSWHWSLLARRALAKFNQWHSSIIRRIPTYISHQFKRYLRRLLNNCAFIQIMYSFSFAYAWRGQLN